MWISWFAVLLVYGVIAGFEVPRLLKNGLRRELYAFLVISLIGIGVSAGYIFNLPLPQIPEIIDRVFGPLAEMVDHWLLPLSLRD